MFDIRIGTIQRVLYTHTMNWNIATACTGWFESLPIGRIMTTASSWRRRSFQRIVERSSQCNYAAHKHPSSGWKSGREKKLHVARREAAYFDILIGESECGNPRGGVCNLIPLPVRPIPGWVSLFSGKSHGPSATPVPTFPQTLFPVPHKRAPNTLDPRSPSRRLPLYIMHEPLIYY